jgi:D-arabinose 5-phosphate isomerase GutQ
MPGAEARQARGSKIIAASKTHASVLALKSDAALVIRIKSENCCGLVQFHDVFQV